MATREITRVLKCDVVLVLLTCLFVSLPGRAQAQNPSVTDIVKKMKEIFEPAKPSTRKVVISVTSMGETVQWVAREARKQSPDGKRMVIVLLEPADLKGNAFLAWEPTDPTKHSTVWVYPPFLRRIRELVGVDAYQHFMGTDFTYADLGFVRLHPQYKLLGEEEHGGKQTYKIEETVPTERAYYSRVVTWVAKDSFLPVQRDYYDPSGALWKTETFEIATINGVPTPIHITMKDLEGQSSTELKVSAVSYDVTIPDTVFDPMQLPALANAPIWQSSGAQAGTGQ